MAATLVCQRYTLTTMQQQWQRQHCNTAVHTSVTAVITDCAVIAVSTDSAVTGVSTDSAVTEVSTDSAVTATYTLVWQ